MDEKLKIGNVIIDNVYNKKWLIFEIGHDFCYVVDFETQNTLEVLHVTNILEIHEKPSNVEYMFIKRREQIQKEYGLK